MSADLGTPDTVRIGFIGAGRLGCALAWSLAGRGLRVTHAASGQPAEAQALCARIPRSEAVSAQAVADACDLVFVTTPDGVIERATTALRWRPGMGVVHCSGVTDVEVLQAAREQGAAIGGFHPMQTFGDPDAAVASLPGSTITVEAQDARLDALLGTLVTRLGCRINRLPAGMRARYHASAGFTSQFVNVLFAQAATVWASWGASEEDVVRAMMPMVRGTLASIESAGVAGGMPGPVSRGDVGSVEKHVAALAEFGPEMQAFYRTMCQTTIELALRHGAIDEARAKQFEAALST
ncbi:Rossmann-like and DUF2520 domain-containing protein [Ramlibacter rhizophilus]|uniref:DUF2520 domain-containing protein n=1 Tax=Ramlibacter rhizophilus TaxID=1781167 RepID=A0A4Z0BJH0_9BURK|nr:DUF2520 domain-containing protein [Ramlibacter rhizophilus]TFY98569.1 DUF2520 domain-containing protein [Ramlibacter rhizophilus]